MGGTGSGGGGGGSRLPLPTTKQRDSNSPSSLHRKEIRLSIQGSIMAEEHRCQALKLCANNCGFFGSPATQNLCSKCYRDLQLTEQQSSNAMLVLNQSLTATNSSSASPSQAEALSVLSFVPEPSVSAALAEEAKEEARTGKANRCGNCRRRVGLTGFKCRCGITFCGMHRYPEEHGCGFDFKALGREEIKKANPVVKAEKLDKI